MAEKKKEQDNKMDESVKQQAAEEADKETVSKENTETAETEEVKETQAAEAEASETEAKENGETSKEETAKEENKKGFFKKKKDKKDEKIEELNDRLMRQMAEFENFRKRSEKEKSQMFEIGAKDVVEKILPVVDNFERGLATVQEEDKDNAFVQGMEQVYRQFITALESAGVKAIEAEGKEFDPNFHNAVMHEEDDSLGENMVAQELQKGYMYRDSVVRHSMVKVVN